jgi:HSP20 family molecular chaperone IbpA
MAGSVVAAKLCAMCEIAETGDMVVITLLVPRDRRDELSVSVCDHTVTVTAPGGLSRDVALPPDADTEHLHAQLFDAFLELRAPRGPAPASRQVPVRVLR